MINYLILIVVVSLALVIIRMFRGPIIKYLRKIQNKIFFHSLRKAIGDADADKERTSRKNIVVYDTDDREFKPVHKRTIKQVANMTKNKSNRKQTEGAKKMNKKRKAPVLTMDRVKNIEKKSLYVTK